MRRTRSGSLRSARPSAVTRDEMPCPPVNGEVLASPMPGITLPSTTMRWISGEIMIAFVASDFSHIAALYHLPCGSDMSAFRGPSNSLATHSGTRLSTLLPESSVTCRYVWNAGWSSVKKLRESRKVPTVSVPDCLPIS